MKATIWHNPNCGTSSKTLSILQNTADIDLTIIEYLKSGFNRAQLSAMIAEAGLTPRGALRVRGSPAEELGLIDNADTDLILDAMVQYPILVERPFVKTEKGTRLCRPQETVHEIL